MLPSRRKLPRLRLVLSATSLTIPQLSPRPFRSPKKTPSMLVKELMIGGLLGFASSIPLAIAIAGGGIIDLYRGTFQGAADPAGGQVTPYGNLFAVISLWLFASIGGFQIVTGTIYSSYDIWAVNSVFPKFDPGADALLLILEKVLLGAVVLAGPLLVIMFLSDIIHLIAAKFGKNIDVGHLGQL